MIVKKAINPAFAGFDRISMHKVYHLWLAMVSRIIPIINKNVPGHIILLFEKVIS